MPFLINSLISVALMIFVHRIVLWIYLYIRPADPLRMRKRYGQWAIVTGGNEGLGRTLAISLSATCGMKVISVARSHTDDYSEVLSKVWEEEEDSLEEDEDRKGIVCKDGVIIPVTADIGSNDGIKAVLDAVEANVPRGELGMVFHCDFSSENGLFSDTNPDKVVYSNVYTPVRLTKELFSTLVEQKAAAVFTLIPHTALHSTLAGCKAFITTWMQKMSQEHMEAMPWSELDTMVFVRGERCPSDGDAVVKLLKPFIYRANEYDTSVPSVLRGHWRDIVGEWTDAPVIAKRKKTKRE